MPQRKNIKGDLGTTKVASDSYDIDNVYFTEEGWVYRHYKKADKSQWWDEIIVAGQSPTAAPDNALETNLPKLGTHGMKKPDGSLYAPEPEFETGGDDDKDFEYSPIYGNEAFGGGVPNMDSTGDGNGDTGNALPPGGGGTDGAVVSLGAITAGTGYSDGAATTSGGTGSGLTLTLATSGGAIDSATIDDAGSGYGAGELVDIVQSGGSGGKVIVNLTF